MDLFRMQCFVCVAEQLNLTKAAELMSITQPAMSVQMRELEKEMGVALLHRDKNRISLTPAGKIAHDGFLDILSLYSSTVFRARATTAGKTAQIRTGYHGSLTAMASLFHAYQVKEPSVEVSVRVAEWIQITDMVVSGELDVAFTEVHEAELRPELDYVTMFTEHYFCVAMPTSHPLAHEKQVRIDQLKDEQILMSGFKSASMDSMYHQLMANGLRKDQIRLVEDVDMSIAMAAAGMGMATMPMFLALTGNPAITWVPVDCRDFHCEIVIAWRKDSRNPYLKGFIEFCQNPKMIEYMRRDWMRVPGNDMGDR